MAGDMACEVGTTRVDGLGSGSAWLGLASTRLGLARLGPRRLGSSRLSSARPAIFNVFAPQAATPKNYPCITPPRKVHNPAT